jgi:hypothetical protein
VTGEEDDMDIARAGLHRLTALAAIVLALTAAGSATASPDAQPKVPASTAVTATDGPLALPAQGGGSLGSLTVEGASQVRIRFERPALKIDLDPLAAPGLESEPTLDILERQRPDLTLPLLRASTGERAVRTPRPWLTGFAVGALARLRQDIKGVAHWQLEIVDARGTVASLRSGEGALPREIPWDGLRTDGTPAPCGFSYSHVLTARDKAGNTRRFVGESFELPAYRVDNADGPCLLFSAAQWRSADGSGRGVSPLLVEAATVLNLHTDSARPLVVTATAATAEEAADIGREVVEALAPLVGGGEHRIALETSVSAGAPDGGTVQVTSSGAL